jgi:quercetin dioxygenase-like cupin family protein
MALFHLYGDESGATRLERLEMGIEESPVGTVRGIRGIPVTTMNLVQFIPRKPDLGMHQSPERQFSVVLRGVLEVVPSVGDPQHLGPGDIFFGDDVDTKGHVSRDVGEEPLMVMVVAIAPEWELPARTAVTDK